MNVTKKTKRIALALATVVAAASLAACSSAGSSESDFDFFGCPPNHTYDYWYDQCVYQPPAEGGHKKKHYKTPKSTYKAPKSTYKAPKTYKAPSAPRVRTR